MKREWTEMFMSTDTLKGQIAALTSQLEATTHELQVRNSGSFDFNCNTTQCMLQMQEIKVSNQLVDVEFSFTGSRQ